MKLTKVSLLTGRTHTKEIDVTEEQLRLWKSGALIQDVCGHLNDADREFIMTGATAEEWAAMGSDDEEGDTFAGKVDAVTAALQAPCECQAAIEGWSSTEDCRETCPWSILLNSAESVSHP